MKSKIVTGELIAATLYNNGKTHGRYFYVDVSLKLEDGSIEKIPPLSIDDDLASLFNVGDTITLSYIDRKGQNLAIAIKNGETAVYRKERPLVQRGPLKVAAALAFVTILCIIFDPALSFIAASYMGLALWVTYYVSKIESLAREGRAAVSRISGKPILA